MIGRNWQVDLQWGRALGAVVVGFVLACAAGQGRWPAVPSDGEHVRPVVAAVATLRWVLGTAVEAAVTVLHTTRC